MKTRTKTPSATVTKTPSFFSSLATKHRYSFVLIILVGLLLYSHTLKFDYTNMDDKTLIADDKAFVSKLASIPKAFQLDVFKEKGGTFYRPIFVSSLIVDGTLGKMSLKVYHFSNIVFHLLSACLLLLLLVKLGIRKEVALLLSLALTVHPALVQAVAWIPGRNDSLLAVFVLSSFICLMNYIKTEKGIQLFLHLLFFCLALFTKETAIVLPLLYLLMLKFWGNRPLISKSNVVALSAWGVSILVLIVARNHAIQTSQGAHPVEFLANIPNNLPALLLYAGKILLPFNLSVMPTIADSSIVYGVLTILFIASLFFITRTKFSLLAWFGTCWFVAFLLPVLVVPKESAFFYEQRLYLPLIGVFILLSELTIGNRTAKWYRTFNLVAIASCLVFIPLNYVYSLNFSDKLSFWGNATKTSPNSVYVNKIAASVYYKDGNLDMAETLYIKAKDLNPNEPSINNDLGIIYKDRQAWDKAISCFLAEIQITPSSDKAYYNLAYVYYSVHRLEDAEKNFEKVISLNPEYTDAYQSLALVNADLKDFEKARYYTAEAQKRGVQVPPDFLKAIQM